MVNIQNKNKMATKRLLSLEDSVEIIDVERTDLRVGLDLGLGDEQLGWANESYQKIKQYQGQTIKLKEIDETLAVFGEHDTDHTPEDIKRFFGDRQLSLRKIKLTKSDEEFNEQERIQAEKDNVIGWFPRIVRKYIDFKDYGNYKEKGKTLYVFVSTPGSIDGNPVMTGRPLMEIKYRT